MSIKDILKTNDVIKVNPDENLSTALSMLTSTHDSAFVFDKDKFMGVINPYYALIKKSFPANTKVRNGLTHPPKLMLSHSVRRAAQMMIQSKIHYLPVFQDKKFVGIVSARRVMKHIADSERLKIPISQVLGPRKRLHTINTNDYLSKALAQFKNNKVSKLVVVDSQGNLAGVLAFYDIVGRLAVPRERQSFLSRRGKKDPLLNKAVKNFYKTQVLTLTPDKPLSDAAKLILEKEIGSVVVMGHQRKPIGIITTKDILNRYSAIQLPALAKLHAKNLSKTSQAIAGGFVRNLNSMLQKEKDVKKAVVKISEKKKGGMFEAVVSVFRVGRHPHVFKGEDTNLRSILQDIRTKTKRVLRKKK